ncbi:hypothetical protein [Idiomarina piscisalsi]|uniref:Uncharacterized protein n=1 Tax=Idiomarina piscisalsi TaxID=1096243 RepID=A0A432YXE7_9GAMM|nr:hypothetical protein [Idiomarina piscisalsi]RUO67998.1 hypothetical protein CWI73_03840 [Idiomarina piscisalsi]
MDIEQIKEFLSSDEAGKALVSELTEDVVKQRVESEVSGLKSKNSELLGKVKDYQDRTETLEQEMNEISKESAVEQGNYKKLLELEQSERKSKTEKLQKKLEEQTQYVQKHVKESGLTEALTEIGVKNPHFLQAAKAMFRDSVEVIQGDDGVMKLAVKDESGQTLDFNSFVKSWADTDAGQNFIDAPANEGGGAKTQQRQNGVSENPYAKDTYNLTEQKRLERENPQLAERLKTEA